MVAIANRAQYLLPSISSLPTFLVLVGNMLQQVSHPCWTGFVLVKNEAKGVSAPNCTVGLGGRVPLPTVKSSKTYHADVHDLASHCLPSLQYGQTLSLSITCYRPTFACTPCPPTIIELIHTLLIQTVHYPNSIIVLLLPVACPAIPRPVYPLPAGST